MWMITIYYEDDSNREEELSVRAAANIRSLVKSLKSDFYDDTLYYEADSYTRGVYCIESKKNKFYLVATKYN